MYVEPMSPGLRPRIPVRRTILAITVAAIVAGCGGSQASPAAPATGSPAAPGTQSAAPASAEPTAEPTAELRVAVTPIGGAGPLNTTNPFNAWPWYPTIMTWQALVGYDEQRNLIPEFAESWTSSDDSKTWTFKISPDKQWSDGEPATARDVAFTFNYMMDSIGTPNELNIGFMSTAPMTVIESVTATDDQTVVMQLNEPSLFPVDNHQFIFPEHVLKDVTYEQLLADYQFPLPLVGTGPFTATELDPDKFIRMERNPHYGGPGPNIAVMVISWIDNPEAAATALKNGEVDVVDGLPTSNLAGLASAPGVTTESSPSPWYWYLGFNTLGTAGGATTDALSDPAFRDAIGYAVDQQTLIDTALLGAGFKASSPMVPFMADYTARIEADIAPTARTFDIEEAKGRLDAAGYVLGADGSRLDKAGKPLALRLDIPSDAAHTASSAQFIAEWLGELGITVTSVASEGATLSDKFRSLEDGGGNWDLAISSWWPEPEARRVFETWAADHIGAGNKMYFTNAEYDSLLAQLGSTVDHEQQLTLASQLAQILYREAPIVMLYDLNINVGYRSDRFTGWVDQPAVNGRAFGNYYPERTWVFVTPVTP